MKRSLNNTCSLWPQHDGKPQVSGLTENRTHDAESSGKCTTSVSTSVLPKRLAPQADHLGREGKASVTLKFWGACFQSCMHNVAGACGREKVVILSYVRGRILWIAHWSLEHTEPGPHNSEGMLIALFPGPKRRRRKGLVSAVHACA